MQQYWHCYEDKDFFGMWCVAPRCTESLDAPRFYLTEEEAHNLVNLLNAYHYTLKLSGTTDADGVVTSVLSK